MAHFIKTIKAVCIAGVATFAGSLPSIAADTGRVQIVEEMQNNNWRLSPNDTTSFNVFCEYTAFVLDNNENTFLNTRIMPTRIFHNRLTFFIAHGNENWIDKNEKRKLKLAGGPDTDAVLFYRPFNGSSRCRH